MPLKSPSSLQTIIYCPAYPPLRRRVPSATSLDASLRAFKSFYRGTALYPTRGLIQSRCSSAVSRRTRAMQSGCEHATALNEQQCCWDFLLDRRPISLDVSASFSHAIDVCRTQALPLSLLQARFYKLPQYKEFLRHLS